MEGGSLDEIAILLSTDKSSVDHDYIRHYEREFAPFRDEPIEFLEIGVQSGASLRLWEDYFSKAKIIGIDIVPDCLRQAGGRRIVEIGSQADPVFLAAIAAKYSPTIIIDDGSHQTEHILISIQNLFPALKPGGCYVIEDYNMHYAAKHEDHPTGALQLALDLAFGTTMVSEKLPNTSRQIDKQFVDAVDRVQFIRHAVFIWKKPEHRLSINEMTALIERSGSWQNWFGYINYLQRRGGHLDLAEAAARKAISLSGNTEGLPYWRLSEVLDAKGDNVGALSAAERALEVSPRLEGIKPRIEMLRRRL